MVTFNPGDKYNGALVVTSVLNYIDENGNVTIGKWAECCGKMRAARIKSVLKSKGFNENSTDSGVLTRGYNCSASYCWQTKMFVLNIE